LTFLALAIHPVPECVACEYANPWGRSDSNYDRDSNILAGWLIVASFVAGFWSLDENWLVPIAIVLAHLATQPLGGVALWSLWRNEGPIILLLSLTTGGISLLAGYMARKGTAWIQSHWLAR
jgi:hypothetical protein